MAETLRFPPGIPHQSKIGSEEPIFASFPPGEAFVCAAVSACITPHSTLHSQKNPPRCGLQRGENEVYLKVLTVSFTVVGLAFSALPSGITSR